MPPPLCRTPRSEGCSGTASSWRRSPRRTPRRRSPGSCGRGSGDRSTTHDGLRARRGRSASSSCRRRPSAAAGTTRRTASGHPPVRSEEHTSELQSQSNLVCRLLLEKKKHEHNLFSPSPLIAGALSQFLASTVLTKIHHLTLYPIQPFHNYQNIA